MTHKYVNTAVFESLLNFTIQRMMPDHRYKQDSLLHWRVKILASILLAASALCLLALGAGVYLAVKADLWRLLAVIILGYTMSFVLLFIRGLSYELRATIALLTLFCVGVAVILSVGPLSGGPIYLFTCAVLAGVLLGSKAAILAVGINSLTLTVICWLISQGHVGRSFPFFTTPEAMIAAVASFVVLNLVVAISVATLVKGLDSSQAKETILISQLEQEREALISAKELLEIEIEDRKQAEAALRDSERKYRLLADNASDIIWTMDIDQRCLTYVSPSVTKIRGFTQEEAVALSLEQILTPASLKKVIEMFGNPKDLEKAIKSKRFLTMEVEMFKKDGSTLWTELSISFFRESKDKPTIALGITRDISERKLAEQERAKLEAQLRQARKMEAIGTLAGGIAHDFNNILSAMIGFTELCMDDAPEGSLLNENLQEIFNAGMRAKELVKQILTFARQTEDEIKPISMGSIVKDALKLIRSTIPSTIQIELNIAGNALIQGCTTQVHQIIMNLCTNAAHAMEPDGGTLTVNLKDLVMDASQIGPELNLKPGRYLQLIVSDTGSGIAPDILPSIFDPYFTTKEVGRGTGMGLAMVHGIVETYKGSIQVESRVGKGTSFTIYLPTVESSESSPADGSKELEGGNERILFVDDEPSMIQIGRTVLQGLGYTVTPYTCSMEALASFRQRPGDFDLVITDLAMPKLTGDQLARELLAVRPDLPIIICTGYSKWITPETAAELGVRGLIYKPIIKADLARIVRKALDGQTDGFNPLGVPSAASSTSRPAGLNSSIS